MWSCQVRSLTSLSSLGSVSKNSFLVHRRAYSSKLEDLYKVPAEKPKVNRKVPSPVAEPNKPILGQAKKIGLGVLETSPKSIERAKEIFNDTQFQFEWFHIFPEKTQLEKIDRTKNREIQERISSVDFLLCVQDNRISLKETGKCFKFDLIRAPKSVGAIWAEFVRGKDAYRRLQGEDPRSPIVRSIRFASKDLSQLTVVDATAGLGSDAFVLAGMGCHVTMIERNPVIHLLLSDGIARARQVDWEGEVLSEFHEILDRMKLHRADSREYLENLSPEERPDVVYLGTIKSSLSYTDPMYPSWEKMKDPTGAKHLSRKEMQIIRKYLNRESDSYELLQVARKVAKQSVVLKRPYYVQQDPSSVTSYKTRGTHFDVYRPVTE